MSALAVPATIQHSRSPATDADLQREVRAYYEAHAGVRFLVDVLTAIHTPPEPVRTAAMFYQTFPAWRTMEAFERRPDLRARVVHAITGTPAGLLRRVAPSDLTAQIELLMEEDLPADERAARAAEDRTLSVAELYLKYLDPTDLSAYLPAHELWLYESNDGWWDRASETTQRLIAAEIKSIRRHHILSDVEIVDEIGNEVLERLLPLRVRTDIRTASRKAARDGRPFTDTDLFDCVRDADGTRDLTDELVLCVPLPHLRKIVTRAARVLGLHPDRPAATPAAPTTGATAATATAPAAAHAATSHASHANGASEGHTTMEIETPATDRPAPMPESEGTGPQKPVIPVVRPLEVEAITAGRPASPETQRKSVTMGAAVRVPGPAPVPAGARAAKPGAAPDASRTASTGRFSAITAAGVVSTPQNPRAAAGANGDARLSATSVDVVADADADSRFGAGFGDTKVKSE